MSEYKIKHRNLYHGMCPPGYEKVSGHTKKDGTHVETHCRKITVKGRTHTLLHGTYNEARVGVEDAILFGDTITDRSSHAESEAQKIQKRASGIEMNMHVQEGKKKSVREIEEHAEPIKKKERRR
jgi:coproporphyrinogen III oxidase